MVKETAKPASSSVSVAKSGVAGPPENSPECLKKLEDSLRSIIASGDADVSEGLENELINGVDQVLLGAAKFQQFVSVLRAVEVNPAHKGINLAIANALWLWGTQVSIREWS